MATKFSQLPLAGSLVGDETLIGLKPSGSESDEENVQITVEELTQYVLNQDSDAGGGGGDASSVTYTPATDADWDGSTDPGNVDHALDQLAERMTSVEAGGGGSSVFSPSKDGGTLSSAKNEYQTVTSGSSVDIVNIASGAGYISSVFLAFSTSNYLSWATGNIKIYYDGEVSPTIDMPMERFFQAVYMGGSGTKTFYNKYFGFNAGSSAAVSSMFCNLPIPFTNGIKITLTNGGAVSYTLWTTTTIHTGVSNSWHLTKKLRAKDFFVSSAAANSVQTLIDQQGIGAGRLAAVWFIEDDVPGSVSPNGATLEGNIKIYLDNAGSPAYESSGTEDYFLLGFYGQNVSAGANCGEVGLTFRNANATVGFYRHHIENPIEFSTGLKITWNVGDTSQVNFTGTARAWATVYYYTES